MENKINIQLIIEGCLTGQEQFERKLFNNYYSYVKSICLRYSSRTEEADEMLNDTFYKVFKYLERYDKQLDFLPWLRKVCVNACLEYNRKYFKNNADKNQPLPFEESLGDSYEIHAIDPAIDIAKCLSGLSPAYRTIFNLYVMDEYKHHEIAEILGISVGTSKSNLSRAKAILRKQLSNLSSGFSKSKMN